MLEKEKETEIRGKRKKKKKQQKKTLENIESVNSRRLLTSESSSKCWIDEKKKQKDRISKKTELNARNNSVLTPSFAGKEQGEFHYSKMNSTETDSRSSIQCK
mgnify:CR=1 FL=1